MMCAAASATLTAVSAASPIPETALQRYQMYCEVYLPFITTVACAMLVVVA